MVTGVICEFNPFHNGHKYLIDKIKENGNSVICCMSGNFVQRGEFAVFDKFTRAETALKGGADLVMQWSLHAPCRPWQCVRAAQRCCQSRMARTVAGSSACAL